MTTLIAIWLAVGFFSYWPLVWHYKINQMHPDDAVWAWICAWLVWTICWPYRYAMDAWYWWRAGR